MSTIALPDSPAPAPQFTSSATVRFLGVHADLMPDEVIAARRVRRVKRRVVAGLAVLLVLLVAWYGYSRWSTSRAQNDLSRAQLKAEQLRHEQHTYDPLVTAQAQSAAISHALAELMTGDLQWKDMLATLRASAKDGVSVTSISASMTSGAAGTGQAAGGLAVLNQTGKQAVGTLTITGTAPDKNAVAAYIDTLAKVKGLAAPFPASVTGKTGKLTFSASVLITSDALGGRFAPAATATAGGK
jgi:Tfp pilus assembly protein PilN